MRRNAAALILAAGHALVAVLAALFMLRARGAVEDAFRAYGTAIPSATALALSTWFLPALVGAGLVLGLAGLALPIRRSRRRALAALGLVLGGFALVFTVWAAFAPVFRPAD